jgi:excisionase family DNA binding protein
MTRLLTKKQVAEWLQCSVSKVEKMMRAGQLVPQKIGGLVRFREDDIEKLVVKIGGTPAPEGAFQPHIGPSALTENKGTYGNGWGRKP